MFVAASVAWALMLPLATYVASLPRAPAVAYTFAMAVYAAGRLVCHQLPERSFSLWATHLPVCARCAGIYAGAAMAAVIAARLKPRAAGAGLHRTALLISVIPTVVTIVYEWTSGQMPGHMIRAAAGIPLGAVAAAVVVAAADNQVN